MDSLELKEHRAMIGIEIEVLAKKFDRFGWDRDRGSHFHNRLISDWMKALQDYPLVEVQAAIAQAVSSIPSKMPHEGHILKIILAERQRMIAAIPKPVEPSYRSKATAEERARGDEIVKAAGIALTKAKPRAGKGGL